MVCILSSHTERHHLCVRTESIQGLYGRHSRWSRIIIVTIFQVVSQFRIVRIWIGAVTATIDIATNTGVDTHSISTCYVSRNIVTSIDIVNVTTSYQDTGRKACREAVTFQLNIF